MCWKSQFLMTLKMNFLGGCGAPTAKTLEISEISNIMCFGHEQREIDRYQLSQPI